MKKLFLKTCSLFSMLLIFVTIFGNYQYLYVTNVNAAISNLTTNNQNLSIDILSDGITSQNAGLILSKKVFTGGTMDLENQKFTVVQGVKVGLQQDLKSTFQMNNKTRTNFTSLKAKSSFKGLAKFEDQIVEYPDRVRLIMKTSYQYNNKQEYDSIFSGLTDKETISSKQVTEFLTKNPEYKKYTNTTTKLTKNDIINSVTDKLYNSCIKSIYSKKCDKNIILQRVKAEVDGYKGSRTITETVDVNKIPMIYDADGTKDFVTRLKESNISKQPGEVRLSNLQIKQSFAQYQRVEGLSVSFDFNQNVQSPKVRNCDGLVGQPLILCSQELNKLNANNNNTNQPITYSGTLLNGFTLGESYSYTLSDSYSILGFTVYDIGVSFYAGYGVGIRIPIDYTVTSTKDRLEKGVSQNYSVNLNVDTVDKNSVWFEGALGNNKAFDGKEAVLEAGAYAKGWIILLDKTVFNEQIGGKYDWGKNLKIPFGDKEKLKIFEGIVEGNDIGLEVILYGIHISGDLKVEGNIRGDLTYECRTLASEGVSGDATNCKDLDDTSLKDSDIVDINIDPITKTSNLSLKGDTDKYYYKNSLGVYQQFGVSLQRIKYKPNLDISLFLRGKVGVDTGEYFGWYWLKTPWLKVYTFEIDLPDLGAHAGYTKKVINTYDKSYIYGFANSEQNAPENLDISTKTLKYEIIDQEIYQTLNGLSNTTKITPYNAFMFGGKVYPNSLGKPVYQTNVGTNSDFYYGLITSNTYLTGISYHGNVRKTGSHFLRDYMVNKDAVELQSVSKNIGQVNNNIAVYYSNATNAIWGTNLGGGKSNVNQIKNSSLNDTKIITLPGINCTYTASGNQKFDDKREEDCPSANKFDFFEGLYNDNGIIKAKDSNGFVFPYKKFNFAFHPQFNPSSNKFFAYIANTSNKDVKKVKIYKEGVWGEIQDSVIGEPKYVQILDSNTIVIIFENYDSSINKSTYTIQKYTFNNQWISDRLYQKSFSNIDNVTDFYYDETDKTLFVSAVKKNTDNSFNGEVYTVRFNGINNTPYSQLIYTSEIDQQKFASSFNSLWPTGNWKITTGSQNGNTYVDTAISSLNVDLLTKTIYLNSYAFNGKSGMQYVSKIKYDSYPMAITTDVENYNDESLSGDNNPQIQSMGLSPNFSGSNEESFTGIQSSIEDEYIKGKLVEINNCYEELYNSHLKDILDAISDLEKEIANADNNTKQDYESAILKLKKLKDFYIKKYSLIIKTKLLGKKS